MAESALGARGLSGVRTMLDELAHMPARVRLDIGALVRYGLAPPDFEAAYALDRLLRAMYREMDAAMSSDSAICRE